MNLIKNQTLRLDIEGYGEGAMGVARHEGRIIFVQGALRGEVCRCQIVKADKRGRFAYAKPLEILEPSPARVEPDCPYYPRCGGCAMRHMRYEEELLLKRQRVQDALRHIGGSAAAVEDILGAADILRYRNKAIYPVSATGGVGFYRARSHEVVRVERCLLVSKAAETVANVLQGWMDAYRIPAYDEHSGRGLVRHLLVRDNHRGERLACVVVNTSAAEPVLPHERELVSALRGACPHVRGILLNGNGKSTNVVLGPSYRVLWGDDKLEERLCGLDFRLSVPSFYQVNRAQCERLYRKAAEFAALRGGESLLDLYCGTGTIGLSMARRAGEVLGVEIVPEAVADAQANAARNKIGNAGFFTGDAAAVARQLAAGHRRPDVVTVDPPRKGLSEETVRIVADMSPRRIVYVSCDCATLARDVKRFAGLGYHAERAVAVDMFPRTDHVETVVLMSRKDT